MPIKIIPAHRPVLCSLAPKTTKIGGYLELTGLDVPLPMPDICHFGGLSQNRFLFQQLPLRGFQRRILFMQLTAHHRQLPVDIIELADK